MNTPHRSARRAFTLVELLIVMALILLLAALAVVFYPDLSTSERARRGALNIQGWMLIAKQRAKRDGLPTGLRFLTYSTMAPTGRNCTFCNQIVYIQQPPDFAVGRCTATSAPDVTPMTATLNTNVQASQYSQTGAEDEFDIQNGDYFELYGGGFVRQILSVSVTTSPSPSSTLTMLYNNPLAGSTQLSMPMLGSTTSPSVPATSPTNAGPNYRVIRQPRELPGEPVLTLPNNVAIDLTSPGSPVGGVAGVTIQAWSNPPVRTSLNPTSTFQYKEIVFSPTGAVIGSGNQNPYDGQIYLWVRDITVLDITSDPQQGDPTLVSVQTRSGLIGAYPPAPLKTLYNNDPYYFTKGARSSGL
jgi:prepilin-type N-terminal cleavage/methylation domain-containing protein